MSATCLHAPSNSTGQWYQSQAAEGVKTAKTGRGVLYSLVINNVAGADRFFYVFDNTAASGTLLAGPFYVPTGKTVGVDIRYGLPFETGVTLAPSTTHATYTGSGTSDGLYTVGTVPNAKRKDQNN